MMFKALLTLSLILCVISDEKNEVAENIRKSEEKINKIVRLPEAQEVELLTIKSDDNKLGQYSAIKLEDCVDEEVYSNEELEEYKDDSDILCAFYAFQANKKKGTGVAMYSDPEESARRFEYFVETVRSVMEINARYDKGEISWTAGVNFFADMSPEEKYPYSHGINIPEEVDDNSGFGMSLGMGAPSLGAAALGGNLPESDEKINKIVRLPEAQEIELLTIKSDNNKLGQYNAIKLEDCVDEEVYSNENLKEYEDDSDILCGFYAFQANKKKGTGVAMYSDPEESARRLEYFAETVRSVTETNASFDKGEITWTAEVNFFADMSPEEKYPYSHGLKLPEDENYEFGMSLGASVGNQAVPRPQEKESNEEKINKIVRLPENMEEELLTVKTEENEMGEFKALDLLNCVDKEIYSNDNLKEYRDQRDVLCGFYAFQANKKKGNGVPTYSDAEESARRMLIFARSVQEVLHINNQYEMGEITWAAKINLFADMTAEEILSRTKGLVVGRSGAHNKPTHGKLVLGGRGAPTPNKEESVEEKVKKVMRLTEADESEVMNADNDEEASHFKMMTVEDCVDESIYSYENLADIESSDAYLCAFYAFQANKKVKVGLKAYAGPEEAKERLGYFTKCVQSVQKNNEQYEQGEITYTSAVNFFCDMTDEERYPYSHGINRGKDLVLGQAEESVDEKVEKIVRLTEADESEVMNADNDEDASHFKMMTVENCVDGNIYSYENLTSIDSSDEYLCAFYAFQANKDDGVGLKAYAGPGEAKERLRYFKKCVQNVQKTNKEYEQGDITYTAAVNFFCDMSEKEKHPYSHGIRTDIAKEMSVFGISPVDLKSEEEKMSKVVRMSESDELSEISSDSEEMNNLAVVPLESCVDSAIYNYENLDEIVSKRDYVCAYYAFQANKEAGEGLMQYKGEKESKKRYHLFSECVDTVKKMNMKFSTGKASYSGAVNFFCDMTDDERKMYSRGINTVFGKDKNNRVLVLVNMYPEEDFEDHPMGNGGFIY